MAIGTAKPSPEEMKGIPHHFIDSHPISDEINAGRFERLALPLINRLFEKSDYVILSGGSGLFIDAVINGFDDMPSIPSELRTRLRDQFTDSGITPLSEQLKELDPEYFAIVDHQNPQRVLRALEVCLFTGKTYTELRKGMKQNRPFETVQFVLDRPREELYNRINLRVDLMVEQGLLNEVKSLSSQKQLNALNTVGYKEMFQFLEGLHSFDKAVELIKRNSRRYAKRQLTWFRRDERYIWIHPPDAEVIISHIKKAK
jgi:tRNA dimethylallyltransferase